MKLRFKIQDFQTKAVEAVVNCFAGQPNLLGTQYRIDPGENVDLDLERKGFKNVEIKLPYEEILKNIQEIQKPQYLAPSASLAKSKISPINLDVEMETGTGKTYCYIKTIFEMNKRYGWSKFIVVVPSIAIREGVYKSLQMTEKHFHESYREKAKFFIYNSKQLDKLEDFSSSSDINIMIINIQAFNSTGKDNKRIHYELDDFQSRRPIDVIKANQPILILDEPQKMEGKKTLDSLKDFNPLMIIRYSATHKKTHNKIYRLDALDAYNQKLVKKISVREITTRGLAGTHAYLYLQSIEVSKSEPVARMEIEIKQKHTIKKVIRKISKGDNLHDLSNNLDQYKDFIVAEIDARVNKVSFTNGEEIFTGEAVGNVNDDMLRRIQIREAVQAHFDKEKQLFRKGIKVLTLFFIDKVSKYRQYSELGEEENGEYATIFEEEYLQYVQEVKNQTKGEYRRYLDNISVSDTHNGYFSIDKKTKKLIDPDFPQRSQESNDSGAYNLILKDKERLLSFEEPTRFIFSHSALREGWDNPNVFVICTLKHSDNTTTRRQEIGRGLRLSVNQQGDRQDDPHTVHETNILTVITNESYQKFASELQREIKEALAGRLQKADKAYFEGKLIKTETGNIGIDKKMATKIYRYLITNDYIDENDHITDNYHNDVKNNCRKELPEDLKKYEEPIFELIGNVISDKNLPDVDDDRKRKENRLNDNFNKKEFKELWNRINKKAVYGVKFDSSELIKKSIESLKELKVSSLQYVITEGMQRDELEDEEVTSGQILEQRSIRTLYEPENRSINSQVKYDLIGKITEGTGLKRETVANILIKLKKEVFALFKKNPEEFISKVITAINEEKATMVVQHLTYNTTDETYGTEIFTDAQSNQFFSQTEEKLKKHIYDYFVAGSNIEQDFINELEISSEVEVYAKLPRGFFIPTPVGNYNPDWAISFCKNSVKHIYFIAETKGSMSSMELRKIEESKIECAKKFFEAINKKIDVDKVKYGVINNFSALMDLVAK